MHPLFGRRAWLTLYLVGWGVGGLVLAGLLRLLGPRPWLNAIEYAVPLSLIYAFVCLSAWWVCRTHPLTGARPMDAVLTQIGAGANSSAILCIPATLWAVALSNLLHDHMSRMDILRDIAVVICLGLPLYLLSAVAHYLYLAFEASHAAERRILTSEVTAREAELRALRAQLNPHFLFNSLNSINALVGSDPEGARRMCERLGDFLRRTLSLGARDAVTLEEELSLVDRYLDIEQVRFGARLHVERDVDADTLSCRVPPLLLQPLVENAVKHGVAGRLEGGTIRLDAHRANGRLEIEVENPVDDDAPARRGEGVGLENVRRRLDAFGAREARLEASRGDGQFRVRLSLPAVDEGALAGGRS